MARMMRVLAILLMGLWPALPAYAAGVPQQVPAPVYPSWACTGSCDDSYGVWRLTAGSSMTTNYGSAYSPDAVSVYISDLVVAQGQNGLGVDVSVDGIRYSGSISANGTYQWAFDSPNPYHIITVYASFSTQLNILVSEQPGTTKVGAGTPTSTPIPTNTPFPVQGATSTPRPTSTPCVIDAWGCDQPPTATYVACETGVTVNYGLDPCAPSPTPTSAATATPTPTVAAGATYRDCGVNMSFYDCTIAAGTRYWSLKTGYAQMCINQDLQQGVNPGNFACINLAGVEGSWQLFTAPGNGSVTADVTCNGGSGYAFGFLTAAGGSMSNGPTYPSVQAAPGGTCHEDFAQINVTGGVSYYFYVQMGGTWAGVLNSVTFSGTPFTATPTTTATSLLSATPGPTWTPRPTATATPRVSPTPPPPGFIQPTATLIANIDSCLSLGSCYAQMTPIVPVATGIAAPISTKFAVDTSPFTALQHLSAARGACTSFGKVPIVVPNVTEVPGGAGTPTGISYAWSTVTAASVVISGTAWDYTQVQPCAMPAIPHTIWDLSWYASAVAVFGIYIAWLIGYIKRLFS